MEPVITASRYGDAGVCVTVGTLAVDLGGGSLVGVEDRRMGEWNEVN